MKRAIKIIGTLTVIVAVLLFANKIFLADLRTADIKDNTQTQEQILYAKSVLNNAVKKQGLDKAKNYKTYQVTATDHWNGFLGKVGNPWKFNADKMAVRFSVGDFDSQVEVLEGDQKGFTAGLQSWNYYEKQNNSYQTDSKQDAGVSFVLSAFHYFFELGSRLADAPFIRYAGTDKLGDKEMEKVFVSWGNEATVDYDQYVVWIGKESGLIEAVTFTTRDNFKPTPSFLYGSLQFDDFREVDGVLIPFLQTAQVKEPDADTSNYVHQLKVSDFKWDNFPVSDIRPLKNVKNSGDSKN